MINIAAVVRSTFTCIHKVLRCFCWKEKSWNYQAMYHCFALCLNKFMMRYVMVPLKLFRIKHDRMRMRAQKKGGGEYERKEGGEKRIFTFQSVTDQLFLFIKLLCIRGNFDALLPPSSSSLRCVTCLSSSPCYIKRRPSSPLHMRACFQ